MTTEDDFQRALDANPDDWQTRLVFADWLEERGDPRAEGYRALGALQKWPLFEKGQWGWYGCAHGYGGESHYHLSFAWRREAARKVKIGIGTDLSSAYESRSAAEDAAALAFAKLPAERRQELLNPKVQA